MSRWILLNCLCSQLLNGSRSGCLGGVRHECAVLLLSWGSAGAGDASGSGGTGGFSGSSCGGAQAEFAACQEAMLWK